MCIYVAVFNLMKFNREITNKYLTHKIEPVNYFCNVRYERISWKLVIMKDTVLFQCLVTVSSVVNRSPHQLTHLLFTGVEVPVTLGSQ